MESAVRTIRKKQLKRVQDISERLLESENAEENRIKGELLTANLYRLEKGSRECTLENWYEPDCPLIKIALDESLSPQKNAQRYFKAYNKQKRAKEVLSVVERSSKSLTTSDGAAPAEVDDSLISIDDCVHEQVIEELRGIDINTLSPYEAMSFLFDLQKRLK